MSRARELVPPKLSIKSLLAELASAWGLYSQARMPVREKVLFLSLRTIQYLAYYAGWEAGVRHARGSRQDMAGQSTSNTDNKCTKPR